MMKNFQLLSIFLSAIIAVQSHAGETWAPYIGYTGIERNYAINYFVFNNTAGFDRSSTYEHENQVYGREFADYGGYWASNLPYGYYDTPAFDEKTIDNFTIGSAEASKIRSETFARKDPY